MEEIKKNKMKENQYQEERTELAHELEMSYGIDALKLPIYVPEGYRHNLFDSLRSTIIYRVLNGCAKLDLESMMRKAEENCSLDFEKLNAVRKESLRLNGKEVIAKYLDDSKVHRAWGFDLLEYIFPENRFVGNKDLVYANELSKELGIEIERITKRKCIKNIRRFALESTGILIKRNYSSVKAGLKNL